MQVAVTTEELDDLDRLAAAAAGGDRQAFTDLLLRSERGVRLFVSARLRSRDLVEEVVQATYVVAWERLATYRGPRCLFAWLKGIALNRIRIEMHEQARLQRAAPDDLDLILEAPDALEPLGEDKPELGPILARCLAELDPRSRLLLERRYADNLSIPHLAQQFKRNTRNLTVVLHRLRLALRACIEAKLGA